jgi:3-phenylpropionate/trans-cinnamate dioxygenase ferredoxin reductase component
MSRPEKIVVVGASLAGQRAAQALRRAGFAGQLTLIGDEVHGPYNRPPLSKAVLRGELELADLALDQESDNSGINFLLGERATALDLSSRVVQLESGPRIEFDAALIATGVSPRRLNVQGADLDGVYYLRTFEDAARLRTAFKAATSLVVIGAGFIGCEVAASARQLGLKVTVIDPASSPMERVLGSEIGRTAQRWHEQHGVAFELGHSVVSLEGGSVVTGAVLDDGRTIAADLIVVGIGSVANTQWLRSSGIDCSDGVMCDETCLVPGTHGRVAAAGDVANWPHPLFTGRRMRVEHWSQAAEQGEAAAIALLCPSEARPFAPILSMWSDQYGKKIQAVGAPWLGHRLEMIEGSTEAFKFTVASFMDDRLVGAVTFAMPSRVSVYRTLLERQSTDRKAVPA